jgi:hypothetical protein
MSERAAIVVPLPLSVVESNIWDVTSWGAFLSDVEWIERNAHERYVFGVRQGRRVHDVPVNVRWYPPEHRVVWRETSGPAWRGEIRLTALNGRRTRVALEAMAHPRSFGASLTDMFGRGRRQVDVDLGQLAERLALIPQPFNPARLNESRRMSRSGVRAADKAEFLASHGGEMPDDLGTGADVEILEAGAY